MVAYMSWDRLTLIKPPSGLARRNAGWAFALGFKSCVDSTFWNLGTGPRPGAGGGASELC